MQKKKQVNGNLLRMKNLHVDKHMLFVFMLYKEKSFEDLVKPLKC